MKKFILGMLLMPLLISCTNNSVIVSDSEVVNPGGFGMAEKSMSNLRFNIACGEKKSKCLVEFSRDRIIVDGKGGVEKSQILRTWHDYELKGFWDRTPGSYYADVYYITYRTAEGTESTGKFIIVNEDVSSNFWNKLKTFRGSNRREIGPNIQVEIKDSRN
jgi:hypothetical protein